MIYFKSINKFILTNYKILNSTNYKICNCGILFIIVLLLVSACTPAIRFSSTGASTSSTSAKITSSTVPNNNNTEKKNNNSSASGIGLVFRGIASYYSDKFEGRMTASGEIFKQNEFTAAHKSLPFGTRVRVTRINTDKSVVVRINDRGPFVAGRIIDLSYSAALSLGIINLGIAEVTVEVLD